MCTHACLSAGLIFAGAEEWLQTTWGLTTQEFDSPWLASLFLAVWRVRRHATIILVRGGHAHIAAEAHVLSYRHGVLVVRLLLGINCIQHRRAASLINNSLRLEWRVVRRFAFFHRRLVDSA